MCNAIPPLVTTNFMTANLMVGYLVPPGMTADRCLAVLLLVVSLCREFGGPYEGATRNAAPQGGPLLLGK